MIKINPLIYVMNFITIIIEYLFKFNIGNYKFSLSVIN